MAVVRIAQKTGQLGPSVVEVKGGGNGNQAVDRLSFGEDERKGASHGKPRHTDVFTVSAQFVKTVFSVRQPVLPSGAAELIFCCSMAGQKNAFHRKTGVGKSLAKGKHLRAGAGDAMEKENTVGGAALKEKRTA